MPASAQPFEHHRPANINKMGDVEHWEILMTRVTGEFTASVPAPIVVARGILELMDRQRSPRIKLRIDESDVMVQLEEQTEPILDEHGYEDILPRISGFKVCIARDVPLSSDSEGSAILSLNDEKGFEGVLVEALRRVVSAIKLRTGQSSIDTRHPVQSYGCRYFSDDQPVATRFPVGEGFRRMPAYARGAFAFASLFQELDAGMWEGLQREVASPVEIPLYDELLHDAVTYRADMNYQMAALSAAISMELMLAKICTVLLAREGNLEDSQIQKKIRRRKPMALVRTIKALDPDIPISDQEVWSVFQERNMIAHGDRLHTSAETMADMIATARRVRGVLSNLDDRR